MCTCSSIKMKYNGTRWVTIGTSKVSLFMLIISTSLCLHHACSDLVIKDYHYGIYMQVLEKCKPFYCWSGAHMSIYLGTISGHISYHETFIVSYNHACA